MYYRIIPLDTLFFRDGKPFTMGAETWAEPIFPPNPSTLYGAIRSWLIFEKGGLEKFKKGELKEELGTTKEKGRLKITGPFVALNDIPRFSIPYDLLGEKDALYKINIVQKSLVVCDYRLESLLLNKSDKHLEEKEGFLGINEIKDYLEGRNRKLSVPHNEKIYKKEPKIGIKRDRRTLTNQEGHLYKIPMIRVNSKENVGFIIKIDGVSNTPDKGIVQLGGEGKTAKIEKIKKELNSINELENINISLKDKIFKIYLATPAIFNEGWIPFKVNDDFEGEYNGIKLKLIACAIRKYRLIGGWDIANKKPKPMYKAVPPGSVYYFKILNDVSLEKIKETFHFKNISDINPEEGFGLSLVGEV